MKLGFGFGLSAFFAKLTGIVAEIIESLKDNCKIDLSFSHANYLLNE